VTTPDPAADDEPMPAVPGGRHWPVSRHLPAARPVGRNHGAAATRISMRAPREAGLL
jgi:hypothetical protein